MKHLLALLALVSTLCADTITVYGPPVEINQRRGNTITVPTFDTNLGTLTGVEVQHNFRGEIKANGTATLVDFYFLWPCAIQTTVRTETGPVVPRQIVNLNLTFSESAPLKLGKTGKFKLATDSDDKVTGTYQAVVTYTFTP